MTTGLLKQDLLIGAAVLALPIGGESCPMAAGVALGIYAGVATLGGPTGAGATLVTHAAPCSRSEYDSVSLPNGDAIIDRDGVTFFCIEVVPKGGGQTWRVSRRYNEFSGLLSQLSQTARNFDGAPFPSKHVFDCSTGARLEERRAGLERWLQRVLTSPLSTSDWKSALSAFLTDEQGDQVRGVIISVDVPAGSAPGQTLGVQTPDGMQFAIPLPDHAAGAATLNLLYDEAAGTLAPVGPLTPSANA